MALINRVSRLFKADFHAVLDQIEEPEQLLRQSIRDMEDEIATAEQRLATCSQEQKALENRIAGIADSVAGADDELDLCFASGKDDLARGLVRRKLEADRITRRLTARFESNRQFIEDHGKTIDENRAALESLRQKAEVFSTRSPSATGDVDESAWLARDLAVTDDEVEIAYLREQSERSGS